MTRRKICLLAFVLLCAWLFAGSVPAAADPPDITGLWHGTWEIAEYTGYSSNFSVEFWDSPDGLLAILYAPDLGAFGDFLPVTINGDMVTIGVAGITEIWGVLDGNSVSGAFYAYSGLYTGTWYAERFADLAVFPGEAPGPPCDDLPPLYCLGSADDCSELVAFEPTTGTGYLDYPEYPETDENRYFSYLRRDLMLLVKYATAKIACKTADWDYGNLAPLGV